jgi:hypothetical protein
MEENTHLVLIGGASASGKSASLMNIKDPSGVYYLNTESNKRLPFKSKFQEFNITDPYQVYEAFDHAETQSEVHSIIVDSLTFLMDQFETQYVLGLSNTMKGWSDFAQYFKKLMQQYVARSTKKVIFTAHTLSEFNEENGAMETRIPVKGSLKNNGIEAYFSTIVSAKRVSMKELANYKSNLLTVTPEEEALGFKYCFQTKLTKNTIHERIRSPLGMFATQETFMNNDAQLLMDHIIQYYK